jgi:Flp pilus assembly protein TadD
MTEFDPLACEIEASRLKGEGRYAEAAQLFAKLIREYPGWEEGTPAFSQAYCLEEIGDFDGALRAYEYALSLNPANPYFLGNYNSLRERLGMPPRSKE